MLKCMCKAKPGKMAKIKISPSLLNEWASLLNGDYEKWGKDESHIVDYILGDYQPNAAVSKGSAVHLMLEHGVEKYFHHREEDDYITADHWSLEGAVAVIPGDAYYHVYEKEFDHTWKFTREAVAPIAKLRQSLEGGIFEPWNNFEFDCLGYRIRMNMRHDYLRGIKLHEFKTSKSAKKYEDYLHSYQMKCYFLACPDVAQITYHAFQVPDEPKKDGIIRWSRYQRFEYLRRGDELEQVEMMTRDLLKFIKSEPELLRKLTIS